MVIKIILTYQILQVWIFDVTYTCICYLAIAMGKILILTHFVRYKSLTMELY